MISIPCLVCNGFNELDATKCAHCGTRYVNIGRIEFGKPIVLRMDVGNGVMASQEFTPLEINNKIFMESV